MLTHQLVVSNDPPGTLDFGVGVNWFDFLGSGGYFARWEGYPLTAPAFPPLDDKDSWSLFLQELTRLHPGFIRFGLPPDPVLNADGTLKKDSVHFRRLDIAAHWCEEHGALVILDTFVTPALYEFPVPEGIGTVCVNMAARDNRVYAREFVVPLLDHVIAERGLKAIRYFNPINEPIHYGVYQTPPGGPDVFRHYVEMYREMRRAMDDAGLGEIGLIGIDKDLPFDFPVFEYISRGIDIDPFVAAYSIHSYRGRFDYDGENPWAPDTDPLRTLADRWTRRLVQYAEGRGKYLLALEVGVFQYGARRGNPAGPATAEGALLTAETIVRMINAGVRGALVWSLTNPDTIDGHWRLIDVRDRRVERAPHPYSTYGMLMRYAPPGSTVRPLVPVEREFPVEFVRGTLFAGPGGELNIILINDHPVESRTVSLALPGDQGTRILHKIVKDRDRLGVVAPETFGADPASGAAQIQDTLGPLSLQVYTTSAVRDFSR